MEVTKLAVPGSWLMTPERHEDDRGHFVEQYREDVIARTVGHGLSVRQVNTSVSRRGVARGIHYALVPPGQAKYVTAARGAFVDFIIDLRVGSPTFGTWDSVRIDDVDHCAVYLAEGLGHALVSLTDDATATYLVSEPFNPTREFAINLLDPEIGLDLPEGFADLIISPKDAAAPTLAEAEDAGLLPSWADCLAYDPTLRERGV